MRRKIEVAESRNREISKFLKSKVIRFVGYSSKLLYPTYPAKRNNEKRFYFNSEN